MKPLAPNSLIQNRYLVVHLIGKGGMGEVYLAVDQRLGSAVALKRTFFADDEMLGGAFEREARTLARLRHPVLPKVSDHFTEGGEQYLVMEHIAGDDLAKRLEGAQKPFPLSWVLFWADQLLDALAYLHSHEPPIIHRDIKPQNLKLTDENHIVLLDFGLSKNSTGQTISSGSSGGSTGSVVGYTPHYAPMEQIRGTGTNPKSDIYSLSATLYQLMTNAVPADALTRADSLLNGSPDPIVPLNELNPEIAKEVSDVILRGMEVSQEKRFKSAKEMQKALRKAFTQMQEAMSAQTIAFNAPTAAELSAAAEQPRAYENHATPVSAEIDSQATHLRSPQPEMIGVGAEPVIQNNGPFDSGSRQSDIKTEVYTGGQTPLYVPAEIHRDEPVVSAEPLGDSEWEVESRASDESYSPAVESYSPDATTPNFSYDAGTPASPFAPGETFSQPAQEQPDPFATRATSPVLEEQPQQQFHSVPQPPAAPPVQKKSKAVWVVGGLAGLFIMAIVAVGAGWFVYSNYYATAAVEPTPSPSIEFTPTPEPTIEEAITNTNSNTTTAELDSNTNSNSEVPTVEPTPIPEIDTVTRENTTPGPRTAQQTEPRRTTPRNNTGQPGAKSTPKKSNRTVILQ